jgi:hypothetical protein
LLEEQAPRAQIFELFPRPDELSVFPDPGDLVFSYWHNSREWKPTNEIIGFHFYANEFELTCRSESGSNAALAAGLLAQYANIMADAVDGFGDFISVYQVVREEFSKRQRSDGWWDAKCVLGISLFCLY